MKYCYIYLLLSLIIAKTSAGTEDQVPFTTLPPLVLHTILRFITTKQLLQYREVNKQMQQAAEFILSTDYSKKLSIKIHSTHIPVPLVTRVAGIKLHIGTNGNHTACTSYLSSNSIASLINNVSHIKALNLKVLAHVCAQEIAVMRNLVKQLQHVEVLKIQQPLILLWSTNNKHKKSIGILHALSRLTFAHLKKLHIDTVVLSWSLLPLILPYITNLQALHIEGSRPRTSKQFIAFIQALQMLPSLQKLCLNIPDLKNQEAVALSNALAYLTKLHTLNLRKTALSPQGIAILNKRCHHILKINYTTMLL